MRFPVGTSEERFGVDPSGLDPRRARTAPFPSWVRSIRWRLSAGRRSCDRRHGDAEQSACHLNALAGNG